MAGRPNFLLIVSEVTLALLGVVLIVLALLKIIGLPASPLVTIILGAVLIYWALRAWMRKEPSAARLRTHIRAGSLVILGLLVIAAALAPVRYSYFLMAAAGCVLVARGLLAGLLAAHRV